MRGFTPGHTQDLYNIPRPGEVRWTYYVKRFCTLVILRLTPACLVLAGMAMLMRAELILPIFFFVGATAIRASGMAMGFGRNNKKRWWQILFRPLILDMVFATGQVMAYTNGLAWVAVMLALLQGWLLFISWQRLRPPYMWWWVW